MNNIRLFFFEINKNMKNIPYVLILLLIVFFTSFEYGTLFKYPVSNEGDIKYLEAHGDRTYIFVKTTSEELTNNTLCYLQKMIDEKNFSKESEIIYKQLVRKSKLEKWSFEQLYDVVFQNHPEELYWLDSCKEMFSTRIGNVSEVNYNLETGLKETPYNMAFIFDYLTYAQMIIAISFFPILVMTFMRDSHYCMNEIISSQNMISYKYIFIRIMASILPVLFVFYGMGFLGNIYLKYKLESYGLKIISESFTTYYLVYFLPSAFLFASILSFMLVLTKKIVAILPIYFGYVTFNVVQGSFIGTVKENTFYKVMIRLDQPIPSDYFVLFHWISYMAISVFLMILSCYLYENFELNENKVATL